MKKLSSEIKIVLKTLGVVLVIGVIVFVCFKYSELKNKQAELKNKQAEFNEAIKATSLNQQIIIKALVERKILTIQQPTVQTQSQPEKVEAKSPEKKEKR